MKSIILKSKQIRVFNVFLASVIAVFLLLAKINLITPYGPYGVEISSISPETIATSFLFFSKYKIPEWLKELIKLVICLFLISLIEYINITGEPNPITLLITSNLLIFKWVFIIGSILNLMITLENILKIYLCILFSKNKISIPIHLPEFILDRLRYLHLISQFEEKGVFIKLYFRSALIHIVVFLLCLFTIYLINNKFGI